MPEWLEPVTKYVIVPMGGWIFWLQKKTTSQGERLAVLEAKTDGTQKSLDRILDKLDGIEEALRK